MNFETLYEIYNKYIMSFETLYKDDFEFEQSQSELWTNYSVVKVKLQAPNFYKSFSIYGIDFVSNKPFEKNQSIYLSKETSATNILMSIHYNVENFRSTSLVMSDKFYSSLGIYKKIYEKIKSFIRKELFQDLISERMDFKISLNSKNTAVETLHVNFNVYSKTYPCMVFCIIFDKNLIIKSVAFGSEIISNLSEDDLSKYFLSKYVSFRDEEILKNVNYLKINESNYKDVYNLIRLIYH